MVGDLVAGWVIVIFAHAYGTPRPIRVSGTTARRAVSSHRNSKPGGRCYMEYSRMLLSGKAPK